MNENEKRFKEAEEKEIRDKEVFVSSFGLANELRDIINVIESKFNHPHRTLLIEQAILAYAGRRDYDDNVKRR